MIAAEDPTLTPEMAEPHPPAEPVLDIRVRWRAGQVLLALAGALTLVALLRPLAPWSPGWLKSADALLLGLGVTSSADCPRMRRVAMVSGRRGHGSGSTPCSA